jgi:hypothetical protein
MKVQLSALWAYTGESALARIAREWGVKSGTIRREVEQPAPPTEEELLERESMRRWGEEFEQPEKKWKRLEPWKIDSDTVHLPVSTPATEAEKLDHDLEGSMEWEIREQARQGWGDQRGKGNKGFVNSLDERDYQKRFVLYALQRFVQSLVGGVYVHSVQPPSFPN